MGLKMKVKSYSFWVSLASAIILILKLIGQKFGFSVDEGLISDLFTSLCAILVILGIIVVPSTNSIDVATTSNKSNIQEKIEIQKEKLEDMISEKVEKIEKSFEIVKPQVVEVLKSDEKIVEVVEQKIEEEKQEESNVIDELVQEECEVQGINNQCDLIIESVDENKTVDVQSFIDKVCLNRMELNSNSDKFIEFLQKEIDALKKN